MLILFCNRQTILNSPGFLFFELRSATKNKKRLILDAMWFRSRFRRRAAYGKKFIDWLKTRRVTAKYFTLYSLSCNNPYSNFALVRLDIVFGHLDVLCNRLLVIKSVLKYGEVVYTIRTVHWLLNWKPGEFRRTIWRYYDRYIW